LQVIEPFLTQEIVSVLFSPNSAFPPSSHSFRRTALTQMSNAGIPLRVIQEISGHRTLDELYKYLEVRPEQVLGAVASLSLLTPLASPEPLLDNVSTILDKQRFVEVTPIATALNPPHA
jgi:integrase/recombinase XerD